MNPVASSSRRNVLWRRILNIVLFLIIAATVGTAIFVARQPAGSSFTEFYILGPGGVAADYQTSVLPGGNINVNLGIVNHERATTTYRVEVFIGEQSLKLVGPFTLENEEKWEEPVQVAAGRTGLHQKVEYRLYRSQDMSPYLVLYIWIDVVAR